MNEELQHTPHEIERRSFEIITQEMEGWALDPLQEPLIKRVIHTTADFSYKDILTFTDGAIEAGLSALRQGATIVTDTTMAYSGINKAALKELGCQAVCYMADEEVAEAAKKEGTTRAAASMNKACKVEGPLVLAIGNAPTALLRIEELVRQGRLDPALVLGVPVGFVNVVESKEVLLQSGMPAIVSRGRKGGSTVAAALCNALLYSLTRKECPR